MDIDPDDDIFQETTEIGSDELLSDDHLRLPETASMLVRLHALRAWLTRRMRDTELEIGNAALRLQESMQEDPQEAHPRRRERERLQAQMQQLQQTLQQAQQSLDAYEEAQSLLEESVAHTTTGERVLVEYFLTLEELLQDIPQDHATNAPGSPRRKALMDVLNRIEHVSSSAEEE
jgi:predicted nuclease with TOPRIM domain